MHGFNKRLIGRSLVSGIAVTLFTFSYAAALPNNQVAWALDDQPTASHYTPGPEFSFNAGNAIYFQNWMDSAGAAISEVTFVNLRGRPPSNVQITAVNSAGYCAPTNWVHGSSQSTAIVACFDASGNPALSEYAILYQARNAPLGTPTRGIAYLLADRKTTANYTANPAYSYNSTGGTNTLTRNGMGNYTASLPGYTKSGGEVLVTAVLGTFGSDHEFRCKASGWSNANAVTTVNVRCFDSTGAAADSQFSLAYALGEPFAASTAKTAKAAYGWANMPSAATPYTLPAATRFNSFGTGALTAQNTGTGEYDVTIPGNPSFSSSIALATAHGTDNSYCDITTWLPIGVACYAQGGAPVDTQFDVAFQTAQ
jgi:hypothetical protein